MNITPDECEARIKRDPKLMAEALTDNDLIGWLVSSLGPLDNDALELGERVRDFANCAVAAAAERMAKDENESNNEDLFDTRVQDFVAESKRLNGSY